MSDYVNNGEDIVIIGQLVTAFQYLEAELLRVNVEMCMPAHQHSVSIIASQLSFKKLAHTFSALIKIRSNVSGLGERAAALAGQLCEIEGQRNKFIHSHYDVMEWSLRGQRIIRRKHQLSSLKRGYQQEETWFAVEDVKNVIERIEAAMTTFHGIEDELRIEGVLPEY